MAFDGTPVGRPRPTLADRQDPAFLSGRPSAALGLGLLLVVAILLVGAGEASLCGARLITPVDPVWRDSLRVAGGLTGLALAAVLLLSNAVSAHAPNRLVLWLILPFIGLVAGDTIAPRWWGMWAFNGTTAPWEEVAYPVIELKHSTRRRGSNLVIDPMQLGQRTLIPITGQQYRELSATDLTNLCVTLPTRRAPHGAIEVRIGKPYRLSPAGDAATASCASTPGPWR